MRARSTGGAGAAKCRAVDLVQHLVLDEADRLLDMGFRRELDGILGLLTARSQALLFSATFPPEVQALV